MNGHIKGFRPQTQKLESPHKTPSNTLAMKELTEYFDKTTVQEYAFACKFSIGKFFPLSLVTVPEDFAKVNLVQCLSRF